MKTKWIIALAGSLLAIPMAAHAQNALGDGRAIGDGRGLDRSTRSWGGRGNDARVNLGEELRFRNSIVTGNAPGGLSFRGNVGYRAPGEFLASSGSDATFGFRRDSAFSGLGGLGIRGTDALQYQFTMTGNNRPPAGVGRLDTSRLSYDPFANQENRTNNNRLDRQQREAQNTPGAAMRDDRGLALATMRSPSAFNSTRNLQPTLMGTGTAQDGQTMGMVASSLRGIAVERMGDDRTPRGFRAANRVGETPEDPSGRTGNQVDNRAVTPGVIEADPAAGDADNRFGKPIFEAEFDRAAKRARPDEGLTFEQKMQALRESLDTKAVDKSTGLRPGDRDIPGVQKPEDPDSQKEPAPREGEAKPEGEAGDEAGEGKTNESGLPSGAAEALRDLKIEIPNFAPEGFDAYSEHMAMGQKLLKDGRYFDAEERFTAALSTKPGDPTASLARVNASLGATLFRSAALNLRTLLMEKPEVSSVRFGRDTLPPVQRLTRVKAMLRQTLEDSQGPSARDAGLLLAYVGLHSKDSAAINDGLKVMGQPLADGDDANAERMIKLATLLEAVWVIEPEPGLPGVERKPAAPGGVPQDGK